VIIRPIEFEDIENRGFLEVLENLVPSGVDKKGAKQILQEIKSNPLHKIFVAQEEQEEEDSKKKILGTTTLEDVSVRKGYDGLGIGSQLITHATNDAISVEGCRKILLYCSKNTRPFYEKLGYKIADDTFVMKFDI
jgi:glucosamine-phosphate N-acetyltransferase